MEENEAYRKQVEVLVEKRTEQLRQSELRYRELLIARWTQFFL